MSPSETHHGDQPASSKLMIAALGVVYGDIGTSPLYAFKQSIEASGGANEQSVLAVLSMIIWALILVVTIKYVFIIMRANNRGEGGTIAASSAIANALSRAIDAQHTGHEAPLYDLPLRPERVFEACRRAMKSTNLDD